MDHDLIKRSQSARDETVKAVGEVRGSTRSAEDIGTSAKATVARSVALERTVNLEDDDA
ncbi:MAG: hypothetical protein AAGK00_08610 [Pseudomonadota bacterium]